jgi:serine phosphatase RsbU (regulator of sigma subunit)
MTGEDRTAILKLLRNFFRIASFTFLILSFSFTVDDTGATWIMWRDSTLLALTLVVLSLAMAAGLVYTTIRLKRLTGGEGKRERLSLHDITRHPYNIWGPMPIRTRAGLAAAVLLMFGTIGPLNALLTPPDQTLRPLEIVIITLASGGISACIVLFGNRKILLIISLALCLGLMLGADPILDLFTTRPPPSRKAPDGSVTLTQMQLDDFRDQRTVVAAGGMVLLSLGYVMFIILLSSEGRQRVRLEAEISIARGIQESLIPATGVLTRIAEAAGLTVPASEVGGDYFDFLELPDGSLAVFAADVAGHGVGAGILGAMTKSAFRAHIVHDPSPASMLTFLNGTLSRLVERKMFITAAYLLLDATRGSARVATAGHPAILHADTGGRISEMRTPSMALGMDRNATFTEVTIPCARGHLFLLYTDGVVESTSGEGEQLGTERLKSMLKGVRDLAPAQLCEALVKGAESFRGKAAVMDDVTVVAVRLV